MGEWMNRGNLQMNMDALAAVQPAPNEALLEIGMGNGYFVHELMSREGSLSYIGCDYSPEMVVAAKQLNAGWVVSGQVQFVVGEVTALPFADHQFDKVFTVNTIYFWEQPAAALREIKRVLKPGGLLVLSLRPRRQMEKYPFTQFGFTLYSMESAQALLGNNGYTLLATHENTEPDIEVEGKTYSMENMVLVARSA